MPKRITIGVLLLCAIGALLPAGVAAEADPPTGDVQWQPHWSRVRTWQYALIGALAIEGGYRALIGYDKPGEPHFRGPFLIDSSARHLLLVPNADTQETLETVGRVLWDATQFFPVYADAMGAAWIAHGDTDLAWQLTMISAQAILSVALVNWATHAIVRRQRPVYYYAEQRGEQADTNTAEIGSFFSGHAALAFTGAGLTCAFHEHLPLFGGGLADELACYGTLTTATAVGLLRVMTDRHYMTDTLFGAALGFAVGYFLPGWLHFHGAPADGGVAFRLTPWTDTQAGGLALEVVHP